MTHIRSAISIGFVVMNYDSWDLALRALNEAIRLETDSIQEYVLYDDGSSTKPPPNIDSRIRLILGTPNLGYTRAVQAAFSHMRTDIVVLFDADAYPLEPFTARIRERFQADERLGQLAFVSEDGHGARTESFVGEPNQWSLLLGQRLYAVAGRIKKQPSSDMCVFSCCMATRKAAYCQIQGFDENFDFLDADLDFSMRLRRQGWRIAADPQLRAVHIGGSWSQLQRERVLRFYKCRWYLLRKHDLIPNVRVARAIVLARLYWEMAVLKAFGAFLFRNPSVRSDKLLGRQKVISFCREHYN